MSTAVLAGAGRWGTVWRTPLTAGVAAGAAALAIARFGTGERALVLAFTFAVLVVVSAIDLERRILPNAIVLPAAAVVLTAQLIAEPARAPEWVIASLGAAALLFGLFLLNPRGMGMGDVKLALLLGAALGRDVVGALVLGSLCVWPVALVLLARRGRAARSTAIPFGPFLALGAIAAGLLG